MFSNETEVKRASHIHIQSACQFAATLMESLEPERVVQLGRWLQSGDLLAVVVVIPDGAGSPPILEAQLRHPDGTSTKLFDFTMSPASTH